ncbi:MAG TPA: RluA family pseudouridine synthase [Candidatus Brocadiia bacterium]|nr:RluA family pseudouridine synthase [Candidatus Brocadiia bacterium]
MSDQESEIPQNAPRPVILRVPLERDGEKLLNFLLDALPDCSKRRIRNAVGQGRVMVNGKRVTTGCALVQDDRIEVPPDLCARRRSNAPPLELEIIYEDERLMVINKPAGISVFPERDGSGGELMRELLLHLNPGLTDRDAEAAGSSERITRPHPVHRLDKGTSGALVIAKDADAGRHLASQFERRKVSKKYLCLCEGPWLSDDCACDQPVGKKQGSAIQMEVDRRNGKPAETRFRVIERFRDFALVEAEPKTGRQHQIRVHLAAMGSPLAVDFLYGRREALYLSEFKKGYRGGEEGEERPILARLSLHAKRISFRHPGPVRRDSSSPDGEQPVPPGGTMLEFEAPLPKDFQVALKQLRKYGLPGRSGRTDRN